MGWLVFCCPPYDFYVDQHHAMLELVQRMIHMTPQHSIVVVEADDRFDMAELPDADRWDIRSYPPAIVGVYRN